jgi:hypothetical protein
MRRELELLYSTCAVRQHVTSAFHKEARKVHSCGLNLLELVTSCHEKPHSYVYSDCRARIHNMYCLLPVLPVAAAAVQAHGTHCTTSFALWCAGQGKLLRLMPMIGPKCFLNAARVALSIS